MAQDAIATIQEKVDALRENLYLIITVTTWLFTIIFIWLGIAQIGLLTQGLERVRWPLAMKIVEGEEVIQDEAVTAGESNDSGQGTVFDSDISPPASNSDIYDE